MAKYRKKPVVVEAIRFDPTEDRDWLAWGVEKTHEDATDGVFDHFVQTLEGAMVVRPGDYIVRGIAGEHYPVKPGIFVRTYDEVED